MAGQTFAIGKSASHAPSRSGLDEMTVAGLRGDWKFHNGAVTGLGFFEQAGGREVLIVWDEGGSSRKQGEITDGQWEIFNLAFRGNGRIWVLSDKSGTDWQFDYRFLEASR